MRIPKNTRNLNNAEIALARSVFGNSLPAWSRISITDGLGIGDRPYTAEDSPLFALHLGPDMYPDASVATIHSSFGRYQDTFIHEMTHVWQFYHGYWVNVRALWAMSIGKGYSYTLDPADAWDDFNVEQQASIVEDWFARGMSPNDNRFVFIDKIIRPGVEGGFWATAVDTILMKMPLDELRNFNL